jgi:cytochrome c-type biogenesis protein CcmE
MNPTRKRRILFVLLFVFAAGVAGTLITLALQENLSYLHTPTEVRAGNAPTDGQFRLGGVVCEGSVKRQEGTLDIRFAVTDRVRQVPVHYVGILPDMFKEGTSIIATGRMRSGQFVAEQVLAKHDETYMPKEVAEAMAKGIAMHTHSCGAN